MSNNRNTRVRHLVQGGHTEAAAQLRRCGGQDHLEALGPGGVVPIPGMYERHPVAVGHQREQDGHGPPDIQGPGHVAQRLTGDDAHCGQPRRLHRGRLQLKLLGDAHAPAAAAGGQLGVDHALQVELVRGGQAGIERRLHGNGRLLKPILAPEPLGHLEMQEGGSFPR